MSQGFIGQIILFGGNFAPRQWAFCDGQLLPINSNQALYSILGTTYGGDGRTTLGLPDLRGRVPIGPGTGPGLSSHQQGQKGGTETNTLNQTQLPSHNHTATDAKVHAFAGNGNQRAPAGNFLATDSGTDLKYGPAAGSGNPTMNAGSVSASLANTGGGQAMNNMAPFNCVYYLICLQGVFPSRN